jgi:hypothetical protein
MRISRNSWHYSVYKNIFNEYEAKSFCGYVSRVIVALLAQIALFLIVLPFLFVLNVVCVPIALLAGSYPTSFFFDFEANHYKPFKIGRLTFYPIHFATPILWLLLMNGVAQITRSVFEFWLVLFAATGMFLMAYIMLMAICGQHTENHGWLLPRWEHRDGTNIVWDYLKSKKNNVCPRITFDGE